MGKCRWVAWVKLLILALWAVSGCATFRTIPMHKVPFGERAQTQHKGDVKVGVSVLTAEESEAAFGVPLYGKGIQPVWVQIENQGKRPIWFIHASVDPDYFSPLEVAYMTQSGFSEEAKHQMDRYFYEHAAPRYIPPGSARSGFVFTNLDEGVKHFNVDVISEDHQVRTFTFFVPVPGLKLDHQQVDWQNLYLDEEIVSLDEAGLRRALERLPCCTTDKDGVDFGDPVNLVVVGESDDVYHAFIRAGWDQTETIYRRSALKTALSLVFGGRYRYSPVSALYLFGRPQDVALQKARGTIHERNHLRLWLAPWRFEGQSVWVGQISRDIGVRLTSRTFVTHKIDPDVDETRAYLLEDLWYSQRLGRYAFVKGVGAATISEPRRNLSGDPYFTDGYRAVLWISRQPVSEGDIEFLKWEIPAER